jgi:hypothetical protein
MAHPRWPHQARSRSAGGHRGSGPQPLAGGHLLAAHCFCYPTTTVTCRTTPTLSVSASWRIASRRGRPGMWPPHFRMANSFQGGPSPLWKPQLSAPRKESLRRGEVLTQVFFHEAYHLCEPMMRPTCCRATGILPTECGIWGDAQYFDTPIEVVAPRVRILFDGCPKWDAAHHDGAADVFCSHLHGGLGDEWRRDQTETAAARRPKGRFPADFRVAGAKLSHSRSNESLASRHPPPGYPLRARATEAERQPHPGCQGHGRNTRVPVIS